MPASTAIVSTEHGSRYLQQLSKHWAHKFAVEFTPQVSRIDMGEGRIVDMKADASALTVSIEGGSPQLEEVVERHIVRFAFREELKFDWVRG